MASVTIFSRASGKANLTSVLDGDQIYAQGLILGQPGSAATAAALYDDSTTQTLTVGAGSALTTLTLGGGAAQTTANICNGAAMTTLGIGTGMGAGDNITIGGTGSTTTVSGDLVVSGTTTSVDSEVVNIADNHLYLNAGYTTNSAETGGLVVNYLPTATGDTSTTGGFATATTVNTVGAATFSAGDFVQVSGAANDANNGVYEVLTHAANVMTIDSTPVEDWAQTAFTVDATDTTAVLTNVTVSVLRARSADGSWEQGQGSSQPITYSVLATGGGNSLQQAYVQGNTISMSDAEGNFDVSVGSGTPAISLDAAGASNFTVDSANLTLSTTTSGTLAVSSAAALDMDGVAVTLDGSGGVSIDGSGAASNFSSTSQNLTLSTITSGTLFLTSAGLLDVDAAANMDIDVTGSFDMLSTGAFSIDGTGASNVTADTGDLTVSTTTSGSLILDGVALVDINAGANLDVDVTGTMDLLSTSTFSIDGTGASNVSATSGNLTLSTITSGDVIANAAGAVDIDAGSSVDILATTTFSIDGTGTSNVSATSGDLVLSTITSGTLDLDSAGAVTIDASLANDAGVSIDGYADSNFTAANDEASTNVTLTLSAVNTGATAGDGTVAISATSTNGTGDITITADDDITFDGNGMTTPLPFNGTTAGDTGNQDLSSNFTATTLVGCLNELKENAGDSDANVGSYITTGRTLGEAVIIDGNASAATATDADALATAEGFAGIVLTVGGAGTGEVTTSGLAVALFEDGISTPAAGDPIYLSQVAGRVTGTAPTGNPNSGVIIYQIGIMSDTSSGSGGTGLTGGTVGTNETAAILVQPMQLIEL